MNFRSIVIFIFVVFSNIAVQAQQTQNVIIITLDGYRWHEVFKGADPALIFNEPCIQDSAASARFRKGTDNERRETLMPFFWNTIARKGQLYGNRNYKNRVNCTNYHLLSYPGYSEMLVGFNHRAVSSNRKIENPSATVLEAIGKQPDFKNEVAAFATWDAFPFILRQSKSEIYVNAGKQLAEGNISSCEKDLNHLLGESQVRSDSITFQYAMEYLKRERPRVTFIGFDGTDANAHAGNYSGYLKAAHQADRMIGQLWAWVQAQPDYRDKTTLFITTDHGRGNGKNNWRKHKLLVSGSRHIWFAVIGPDTPAFGEMKMKSNTYQSQVAKTIAAFLGLPYKNDQPVGDVVQTMIAIQKTNHEETSAHIEPPVAN